MSEQVAVERVEPGSAAWWAAHAERLRRRRPRSGGFTVETIVDAALRIVDAEGADALTVRRLASSLGTSSASLYRHVASVDELLVLLVDRALGEVDQPADDLDPRDRVVALAAELRRVLLAHPGVVPALRAAPLGGPNAAQGVESGLRDLLAMGFPPEVAVPGCLALIDYVLGSVFFDSASAGERARTADESGPSTLDAIGVDEASLTSDEVFRAGVETFLDGLATRARPPLTHASGDR